MHELGNTTDHAARLAQPRPRLVDVAVLTFTYIVSFVDRTILGLLIEPIKAELSLNDTQIGLVQGMAFGVFYAVMGLPLGWLADRTSRRGLIAVGAALWCAATAACGLASTFVAAVPGAHRSRRRGGRALPRRDVDHQRFVPRRNAAPCRSACTRPQLPSAQASRSSSAAR